MTVMKVYKTIEGSSYKYGSQWRCESDEEHNQEDQVLIQDGIIQECQ